MSRVITFSRTYPKGHPRQGEPTYFVEKVWESIGYVPSKEIIELLPDEYMNYLRRDSETIYPKHTTIRAGHNWKAGDWFSPRVWGTDINPKTGRSGPYNSKQIQFAPDIQIKKVWDFKIIYTDNPLLYQVLLNGQVIYEVECCQIFVDGFDTIKMIAENDGLDYNDFLHWFIDDFDGQIICWNENINYSV